MRSQQVTEDMVAVLFVWSSHNGLCYDCGLPAAYKLEYGIYGPPPSEEALKMCCVCAADYAAQGITIERLEPLDD